MAKLQEELIQLLHKNQEKKEKPPQKKLVNTKNNDKKHVKGSHQ